MRHIKYSQIVLLLICCFGLQYTASAQDENKVSLKEALEKGLVILKSAVADSKISGNQGIELSLVNITCNNIVIEVDPALVFRSKAAGAPELILAGNQSIELASEKPQKVTVAAYITKNDGRDAIQGEKYRLYKKDASLVKLLDYTHNSHISTSLTQKAILAVADGAALSSVYDAKQPKASKKLQKFLASSIQASSRDENTRKFAALKPPPPVDNSKMVVSVDVNIKSNRNLNVYVLDADGFVSPISKTKEYVSGNTHTIDLELDTTGMHHGTYTVYVRDDDNKIWSQQTITI